MKANAPFSDYQHCFEEITDLTMPIAVFSLSPNEVEKTIQLSFSKGYDDLDYLQFALIELPKIRFALVYHERSPEPGLELCTSPKCKDISATIQAASKLLKIKPKDVRWVHPNFGKALQ
jgi:hypothetical protein